MEGRGRDGLVMRGREVSSSGGGEGGRERAGEGDNLSGTPSVCLCACALCACAVHTCVAFVRACGACMCAVRACVRCIHSCTLITEQGFIPSFPPSTLARRKGGIVNPLPSDQD